MVFKMKSKFSVNIYKKMLEFCSEEEIDSNPRLKLLKLRDRGEIEFRMAKAVPLKEWLIPKDIFNVSYLFFILIKNIFVAYKYYFYLFFINPIILAAQQL